MSTPTSISGKYERFRRTAEAAREEAPMPEQPDVMASAILRGVADITHQITTTEALRVQQEFSQVAKIGKIQESIRSRAEKEQRRIDKEELASRKALGPRPQPQPRDPAVNELSADNLIKALEDILPARDNYDSFKETAEEAFNDYGKKQAITPEQGKAYDQMLLRAEAYYKQPAMGEEAHAKAQVAKAAQNFTNQFLEKGDFTPEQFTRYASGLEKKVGNLPGGQVAMKAEMGRALSSMSSTSTVKAILATPGLDNIYTPDEQKNIIGSAARLEGLALQSDQFATDAYEASVQQAHSVGRFVPDLMKVNNPSLEQINELLGTVGSANLMSPEQIQQTPEFQASDTARAAATTLTFNQTRDFGSDFPYAMAEYGSAVIQGPDKSTLLRPVQIPIWNPEEKTVENIPIFDVSFESRRQVWSKERQARGYPKAMSTPFSKGERSMLSSLAAKMDPDQRYELAGRISNPINNGEKSIKGIGDRASGGRIAANSIGAPHMEAFLNYESAVGGDLAPWAFIAYENARNKRPKDVAKLHNSYKNAALTSKQYDMRAYGNERLFIDHTMDLAVGANIMTDTTILGGKREKTSGEFMSEVGRTFSLVQPFGTKTPVFLPKELDTKAGFWGKKGAEMLSDKIKGISMARVVEGDVYEGASKRMKNLGDFAKLHKDLVIFKNFNGRYDQVEVFVAKPGPNNTLAELERNADLKKFEPLYDSNGEQLIISMSE